jgi:hypothetical protein
MKAVSPALILSSSFHHRRRFMDSEHYQEPEFTSDATPEDPEAIP